MSKISASSTSPGITFPSIEPLFGEIHRPFWSVMITSYNRTEYLEQCIQSVLAEGFSPEEMQIEVVDDHSTKADIEKIVQSVGQGRVNFYRQPENVGIYENWNTCIRHAHGYWIHILNDDDQILPGFYQAYQQQINQHLCLVMVGQSVFFNEKDQWTGVSPAIQEHDGLVDDAKIQFALGNPIRTPGIVVAREAYEKVGGFTSDLVYTPDWEMWARLAAFVKVGYVHRPFSLFREHSNSQTYELVLAGASVSDALKATAVIQSRFTDSQDHQLIQTSVRQYLSNFCQTLSGIFVKKGNYHTALSQAVLAVQVKLSFYSLKNFVSVLVKILISFLRLSKQST